MERCSFCSTTWVDRTIAVTGIMLTALQRRQLVAALLSRQHLILSGRAGIGKRQLAHSLALSIAEGRQDHVRLIQGHPWWAAGTGNVAFFVNLQTQFSVWQLAIFKEAVLHGAPLSSQNGSTEIASKPGRGARAGGDTGNYVVCVEQMSPLEIELYFSVVSHSLSGGEQGKAGSAPIRLIGTYDSPAPPDLDEHIARVTALVHLDSAQFGDIKLRLPGRRNGNGR